MGNDNTAEQQRFAKLLEVFHSLNPEVVGLTRRELLAAAQALGPPALPVLVKLAGEILPAYLGSPVKKAEGAILHQYYHFVEKAAQRLIEAGAIPSPPAAAPATTATTMALVPRECYSTQQWLEVHHQADLPMTITAAADAAQRRNLTVESVLEPLFSLMLAAAREPAFAWQLQLCADPDTPPDPDVARDLLRAWRAQETLPAAALRQAVVWSSDEKAARHWPAVVIEADRLLRRHGLRAWLAQGEHRYQPAVRLLRLAPFTDEDRLLNWVRSTVAAMGDNVEFFCQQSEQLADLGPAQPDAAWRQDALFRQVAWLSHMLPPVLLLSDILLVEPNGAFEFAMAVFGFTSDFRRQWRRRLLDQSAKAIRRCFLRDLRLGRPPADTIHVLCFGDALVEAKLRSELDLISQRFDSLKDRDEVIGMLAELYAGYREDGLLAQEIGHRYRRLMRLLHEDSLRRVLTPAQWEQMGPLQQTLLDLAAMASESRRFLSLRRALDRKTAELIAADADFTQGIRNLRTTYARRLLEV
jgi:hypothetical protein